MNRRDFVSHAGSAALLFRTGAFQTLPSGASQKSSAPPVLTDQGLRWKLENAHIRKELWWNGTELHGALSLPGDQTSVLASGNEIFVLIGGHTWPGDHTRSQFKAARHGQDGDTVWLELLFTAPASPLEVTMRYVCRRADIAIEQTCRVQNTGTSSVADLHRFDACSFLFPLGAEQRNQPTAVLHWIEGLHDDEKLGAEPYRTYRVSKRILADRDAVDLDSGRWSSNEKLPAVVLEAGDHTYFAGLGWSGEWSMSISRHADGITVQAGLDDTSISLQSGDTVESAPAFCGLVHGPANEAWSAIHTHCREAIMPPVPDDFPWVTYNTWYNFGVDLREDAMRQEAERAARLGVEVFYIDDGWFEGSATKGKWGMGSGHWVENREKFPSGLAAFADHVHGLGMKFGLWVEPERLDAKYVRASGLPKQVWLATVQDQRVRWGFTDTDGETPAYQVCFGCPEARQWVTDSLTRMVHDYKVDWIKWDHNRYTVCQDWRHGHGSRDGDWAHTQGVWSVMAELRRRFPHLILENCAAGGHRFDFGMMRQTHVTWTSDQTSPGYVSRRHVYGASHPFPPQYLTSWYVPDASDDVLAGMSAAQHDALFRSHMLGAFGMSAKLGEMPPQVSASAKRSISAYKRFRRFLRGELAWLTPQPPIQAPRMEEAAQWEATEMWLPDSGEIAVFLFRAASVEEQFKVRPQSVHEGRSYLVWDEDGRVARQTLRGTTLMREGVIVHIPEPKASAILYLKRI